MGSGRNLRVQLERLDQLLSEEKRLAALRDVGSFQALETKLVADCHPKQRAFVLDPSRRISALVARGGGKTTGGRARFVRRMLRVAKAQCLYVATTRQQAEELMWAPLKDLFEQMGIGARFNETKMICTLTRNGSRLRLVGADDKREIEKLRGQPFHEVGIDEGASHDARLLDHLVFRIIGPRLGDYGGVLWIIGTPGHLFTGPFYDATRPGSPISRPWEDRDKPEFKDWQRWSLHRWNLEDASPYVLPIKKLWVEALLEKEANGWSDQHPVWRREYMGQWAADDTENVYRYRPFLDDGSPWNIWTPLPTKRDNPFGLPTEHEWRFVYGMDLGHSDPFALEVFAYADTCKDLYQVYEYTQKGMTVRDIARVLQGDDGQGGLYALTGIPDGIVADTAGLGDMVLKELSEVYGISVEPAEKKNKHDAIELWNGDLIDGHIKLLRGKKLEEEQLTLQWAMDDYGKLKEDKAQANHCSDAAVYARRKAMHKHAHDPAPPPPLPGSPEALALRAAEEEAAAAHSPDEVESWYSDNNYDDFFRGQ